MAVDNRASRYSRTPCVGARSFSTTRDLLKTPVQRAQADHFTNFLHLFLTRYHIYAVINKYLQCRDAIFTVLFGVSI